MDTFRELESFFRELPRRLEEATHRALKYSADEVEKNVSEIFRTEGRSHGVEWSPLNEAYLRWKIKKGFSEKKLHKTTSMRQSLGQEWIDRFTVVVGVNARDPKTGFPYPIAMEYGTRRIPPRPFMTPVFRRFIESGYLKTAFSVAFREVFG